MKSVLCVLALALGVKAQDPATGWMAYAVGDVPDSVERITKLQMTWKVGADPKVSRAFFSPWFGMDPDDNLNLIQPVNPWSRTSWSMYTEYYQWSPTHNSNSKSFSCSAGDTLTGLVEYDEKTDSYTLTQTNLDTGDVSSQVVEAQNGKAYRVPYVVYEKTFPCADYPPDENVTFYDIFAECDGADCTDDIEWRAEIKDDNCDMAATIIDSRTISITWDTSLSSKYDGLTDAELFDLNFHGPWATKLSLTRPGDAQEMAGAYADPNHPGCARTVDVLSSTMAEVSGADAAGGEGAQCDGETDVSWGPLNATIDDTTIVVDFSPKGGPSDLTGTYSAATPGITWEDGNVWTQLP